MIRGKVESVTHEATDITGSGTGEVEAGDWTTGPLDRGDVPASLISALSEGPTTPLKRGCHLIRRFGFAGN